MRLTFRLLVAALCLGLLPETASAGKWNFGRGDHDRIVGSGRLVTEKVDVGDFDSIRVTGVADVSVEFGNEFSVEITAEDNLIEFIRVRVRRGELVVDTKDNVNMDTDEGLHVDVVMPKLREVSIDGVGNLVANDVDEEELILSIDGVGDIEMTGKVELLEIDLDGVGDMNLRRLIAEDVEVSLDGVGDVQVHASESLEAEVDGMGDLHYWGEPQIIYESANGFGDIVAMDL